MVAMLYNRCETATFTKIKQGVQDMMHRLVEGRRDALVGLFKFQISSPDVRLSVMQKCLQKCVDFTLFLVLKEIQKTHKDNFGIL